MSSKKYVVGQQGRKSMFKHGGDNIGVNIHPACVMYRGARSAALC